MTESTDLVRRTASLPGARGRPAITQGAYGARGNLELVFADPDDGLWVCWFNSDDHHAVGERGALAGEWSGGLHFAAGRVYDSVAITQAKRGPDFLELVAVSGPRLEHWTWTPATGFAQRELIADAPGTYASTIRETDEGLAVAAVSPTQVRVWTARSSTEPLPHWESEASIELLADATAAAVRLDRNAKIQLATAAEGRLRTPFDRADGTPDVFAGGTGHTVHALELVETPAGEMVAVAASDTGIHAVTRDQVVSLSTLVCSSLDVTVSTTSGHGVDRLEVVARDRDALVHLRARLGASGTLSGLESSRRIESTVWWPSTEPIHRRG